MGAPRLKRSVIGQDLASGQIELHFRYLILFFAFHIVISHFGHISHIHTFEFYILKVFHFSAQLPGTRAGIVPYDFGDGSQRPRLLSSSDLGRSALPVVPRALLYSGPRVAAYASLNGRARETAWPWGYWTTGALRCPPDALVHGAAAGHSSGSCRRPDLDLLEISTGSALQRRAGAVQEAPDSRRRRGHGRAGRALRLRGVGLQRGHGSALA